MWSSLPEWLKSWLDASTAVVTAAATAMTAFLMWIGGRRAMRMSDPVVECYPKLTDGEIVLVFVLRNRFDQTVHVRRAELKRPRGGRITDQTRPKRQPGESHFLPAAGRCIDMDARALPAGAGPTMFAGRLRADDGDQRRFTLNLQPPPGWSGGRIRIDLMVEINDATIRSRRIAVRRIITLPKAMQSDTKVGTQV